MNRRIWLLEFEAYNKTTLEVETFYFSTSALRPFPSTDEDRPDTWYEPRLKDPANFERYLFGKGRISGSSSINSGIIELANSDGDLDFLFDYGLDGRKLTILVGYEGMSFAEFEPVLAGTMEAPAHNWNKTSSNIQLKIRDRQSEVMKLPLQVNRYAGTNSGADGVEGTENDIKGNVKPLCFGECLNVTAIPVNTVLNIYQVHDGEIFAVDNVYDNGVALTFDDDYEDLTALQSASISGGYFGTCLALGLFRTGGTPSGRITADVKGEAFGSYVVSVSLIILKILLGYGGLLETDIDEPAFTALEGLNSSTVGIYIDDEISIGEVLDKLVTSIGSYWTTTDDGLFTVGRLTEPSETPIKIWEKEDILEIERAAFGLPCYESRVLYAKNWTVQTDGLAESVSSERRAFLAKEFRSGIFSDVDILTPHPLANINTIESLLVNLAPAEEEAERMLNLLSVPRQILRVVVPLEDSAAIRKLGSTHQIKINRYGMELGKNFVLTGIAPSIPNATFMTLEMWG
jgi:hypothetical protein